MPGMIVEGISLPHAPLRGGRTSRIKAIDLPGVTRGLYASDGLSPRAFLVDLAGVDADLARDLAARWKPVANVLALGCSETPLEPGVDCLLELLAFTMAPGLDSVHGVDRGAEAVDGVIEAIDRAPVAASICSSLLSAGETMPVHSALVAESHAYGLLLASPEFAQWLAGRPDMQLPPDNRDPVSLRREGEVLFVELNLAARRNAFGRSLRDSLVNAFELVALDPSIERVHLSGAGPNFSAGGDLAEFGSVENPGLGALLRVQQSVGAAVHRVRDRTSVRVHGACVGAGIEVPAFASLVSATPDAWFQLPELGMGLVPGAGGTVSIADRIGRWRAAFMMISGEKISAQEALGWGLVDEIAD